ncbi:Hypothetical protein ERGA_CDS_01670 [Ehrlichia ruminantium str. Gardel]|nr:Hypothetical protein ERGA_CDS_01670 [Ehrlichia ruminantium str. Gardel]
MSNILHIILQVNVYYQTVCLAIVTVNGCSSYISISDVFFYTKFFCVYCNFEYISKFILYIY